tara:strand:- start:671 stop:904 length:234 start_codon:yes stop_codon:yes gene_type:complete
MLTQEMITALNAKYQAEIAAARANLLNYLQNPVAVGEHPDLVSEIDKLISAIATAEGKLTTLTTLVNALNESGDNRK